MLKIKTRMLVGLSLCFSLTAAQDAVADLSCYQQLNSKCVSECKSNNTYASNFTKAWHECARKNCKVSNSCLQ